MQFVKLVGSIPLAIFLMSLVAISCGVATFVENDFGTQSAKSMVYNSHWFAALLVLFAINLSFVAYRFRMWQTKKLGSFLFHSSFVVILLGAIMTRYLGHEGIVHIRNGESTNRMLSSEAYIIVTLTDHINGDTKEVRFARLFSATNPNFNSFEETIFLKDRAVGVKLLDFKSSPKSDDELTLEISHNGETKSVMVSGSAGNKGRPEYEKFGALGVNIEWGSKEMSLPFSLHLRKFDIERYPGSMMPSSYASEVTVLPSKGEPFDFRIYMNNVLDFEGFRFFQSSYDKDEQGTILSVNRDPGKIPTYIGYFMLTLGFILNFFATKSRFSQLAEYAKRSIAVLAPVLLSFGTDLNASQFDFENYAKNSKEFSKEFGKLLVQDSGGRIKPIDTLSREIMLKVARSEKIEGMDANQHLLGMIFFPNEWKMLPLITISTPQLKELLKTDAKRVSFSTPFEGSRYLLEEPLSEAHLKKPAQQGKFDKDLIKVDERLNILYSAFQGAVLRVFPLPDGGMNNRWQSPISAIKELPKEQSDEIKGMLKSLMGSFQKGVATNEWSEAVASLERVKEYQRKHGASVIPSDFNLNLEINYNNWNIFYYVGLHYLIIGLILFVTVLVQIVRQRSQDFGYVVLFSSLIGMGLFVQMFGMVTRWMISGHAPWSDAYESMVYIAWAAAFGGVVLFRRFPFALAMSSIMAGVTLFTAHLGFMDPQITNLVPVLKSYWLNIHVSVITASYGFLGLSWLMGIATLILFMLRSKRRIKVDGSIHQISAINEMSVIIGLALLTVGNFLGGVWANESWGRYWGWDPKETWSLVSIFVYAAVLHLRLISKLNTPFVFAVATAVAFGSILMTYFGVNFYLTGMHSYASGDPVPIPSFVYYGVGGIFTLIAAAFFKKDLGAIPLHKK